MIALSYRKYKQIIRPTDGLRIWLLSPVYLGIVEFVDGVGRDVEEGVEAALHDVADGGEPHDAGATVLAAAARVLLCEKYT